MAAMLAPIVQIRPGKGRQTAAAEAWRDARDDLLAHEAEALAFVDAIRPLVDRLHIVAVEIGPLTSQTVNTLAALIDRYERRHLPTEGEAA